MNHEDLSCLFNGLCYICSKDARLLALIFTIIHCSISYLFYLITGMVTGGKCSQHTGRGHLKFESKIKSRKSVIHSEMFTLTVCFLLLPSHWYTLVSNQP